MVVGARQAVLGIWETPDVMGFQILAHYMKTISRIYNIFPKKSKYPVSNSSVGEHALLMLEVRGEWPDWFELIERQQ